MKIRILILAVFGLLLYFPAFSQIESAPDRDEGDGHYGRLILSGVTLIDGTGAPPVGSVNIVVEKNKIAQI